MESYRSIKVYEGTTSIIITGRTRSREFYRVLKLIRHTYNLVVDEETMVSKYDLENYLSESSTSGSPKLLAKGLALLGFTKFLQGYYIFLVTKRTKAAMIRNHSIYKVEDAKLIKLFPEKSTRNETKYKEIFDRMNLSTGFYFSYSYDLTHTLQENICFKINDKPFSLSKIIRVSTVGNFSALEAAELDSRIYYPWKSMYVWNNDQLMNMISLVNDRSWITPIIHGYVGYKSKSYIELGIVGRQFDFVLIARRSRYFAGTRYLKRGVNEEGKVANDVESEQILVERTLNGSITSYVIVRGSIPLFWCQEPNPVIPRPDIICKR